MVEFRSDPGDTPRAAPLDGGGGSEVTRDPETGALSRKDFLELLAHELCETREGQGMVALAHIELDGLVALDAPASRALRQACTAQFGRFLRDHARVGESLGRGPEGLYRWLMPGAAREEALFRVEELRRLLAASTVRVAFEGSHVSVQASLRAGVAASPGDGATARDLSRSADGALHRASQVPARVALASRERMVLKSNFYPRSQLERLANLARAMDVTEAELLREALDDLLDVYRGPDASRPSHATRTEGR